MQYSPILTSRSINVPSKDELHQLLDVFWFWARTDWLTDLTHTLEKIRLVYFSKSNTGEKKTFNLTWLMNLYAAWCITLDQLRFQAKHTATQKSEIRYQILLQFNNLNKQSIDHIFWEIADKGYKERINQTETDTIDHSLLIMLADIKSIEKHYRWIELLFYLVSILAHPNHLLSADEEYQNKFFNLFFKHIKLWWFHDTSDHIKYYLLKYFWNIECVKNKYWNVSDTKDVVRSKVEMVQTSIQDDISIFQSYLPTEYMSAAKETLELYATKKNDTWKKLTQRKNPLWRESLDSLLELRALLLGKEVNTEKWKKDSHNNFYEIFRDKENLSNENIFNCVQRIRERNKSIGINSTIEEIVFISILFGYSNAPISNGIQSLIGINNALLTPLMFPVFFESYSETEKYFSWWLKQIPQNIYKELLDKNSNLWRYIHKHFWFVNALQEKYKELFPEPLSKQSYKWLEEWKDVPTRDELEMLLKFNSIKEKSRWDTYDDFLKKIWQIYLDYWPTSHEVESFMATEKINESNKNSESEARIPREIVNEWDLVRIYKLVYEENVNTNTKKLVKKYLLTNFELLANVQKPVASLIAARLVQVSHQNEKELLNIVWLGSMLILTFPPLLKSKDTEEQDNYFTQLFKSFENINPFNQINSELWEYLLKYFWDNKVVNDYYTWLFSEKQKWFDWVSERFESVWNEAVQSNERTYAESIEKYWEVSEIRDWEVKTWENWNIYFEWTNVELNWRTIHIVIYSRSNKWNLSNPQFFTIPEWKSTHRDIDFNASSGKYSYKVFACKSRNTLKWQSELPKEVWKMQARQLKLSITDKKEEERAPARPAKKAIQAAKPIKGTLEVKWPCRETLEVWIATILSDIQWVEENSIITFEIPEWLWVLEESGYRWEIIDRKVQINIAWEENQLIYLMGTSVSRAISSSLKEAIDICVKPYRDKKNQEIVELAEKQNKKDINASIELLWNLPDLFLQAERFFRSCDLNDLEEKNGFIWENHCSELVENFLTSNFENLWIDIKFKKNKSWKLEAIIISSIKKSDSKAKFLIGSSNNIDTMQVSWKYTQVELWVFKHLLSQALWIIIFNYYKNSKSKNDIVRKKEIDSKIANRESVRIQTQTRLNNGTARFIEWWEPSKFQIDSTHVDIDAYPILWKVWSISIWDIKMSEWLQRHYYETALEEIQNPDGAYLRDYLYQRIMTTLWLWNNWTLINGQWSKIIKNCSFENIKDRECVCITVLGALYHGKVPFILMNPIEFSLRELKS